MVLPVRRGEVPALAAGQVPCGVPTHPAAGHDHSDAVRTRRRSRRDRTPPVDDLARAPVRIRRWRADGPALGRLGSRRARMGVVRPLRLVPRRGSGSHDPPGDSGRRFGRGRSSRDPAIRTRRKSNHPPRSATGRSAGCSSWRPPRLGDPRFAQTVVLLLEYDGTGALGLVVNRPTQLSLDDALVTPPPESAGHFVFPEDPSNTGA